MHPPVKLLERRYVFHGRVFQVRQDRLQLPNGREAVLDIVEHHGAVVILPVDAENRVWFVRQYRHAVGETLLELPAGTLEPGESPQACAQRELQEEIGMRASTWVPLGRFYSAPGYTSEIMVAFLARDLSPASLPRDEDEIMDVAIYPWPQVWEMVRQGIVRDAKTLATLFLALPHLPLLE